MSLLTSSSTTGGLYLYLPYLSNRLCGKVTTYLGTVQVSVVATRLPPVAATATAAARERNATYRSRRVPEISHKASFLIMQAKSSRSSTLSGPSESCDAYRTGWEKKTSRYYLRYRSFHISGHCNVSGSPDSSSHSGQSVDPSQYQVGAQ